MSTRPTTVHTGLDWQLMYLPLLLVAGPCFFATANRYRSELRFVVPWVGGAVCWVVAQSLELVPQRLDIVPSDEAEATAAYAPSW